MSISATGGSSIPINHDFFASASKKRLSGEDSVRHAGRGQKPTDPVVAPLAKVVPSSDKVTGDATKAALGSAVPRLPPGGGGVGDPPPTAPRRGGPFRSEEPSRRVSAGSILDVTSAASNDSIAGILSVLG